MRLPLPFVAALAALALVAGCGGADTEPAAFAVADVVPASAAASVSVQTDLDGDQWQKVDSVLSRFPEGQGGVRALLDRALAGDGLDYERDVEPALGPTVELVWLDFGSEPPQDGTHRFGPPGGEGVVALTQPDDAGKLRALARKADEPLVVGEIESWSAVAESQELLDRYERELAKGALADDAGFRDTSAELPGGALAAVYVDGEHARAALSALATPASGLSGVRGLGDVSHGVAALEALDEGFRLTAHVKSTQPVPEREPSELLGDVPAGAFLALAVGGRGEEATESLRELERAAGVPLSKLAAVLDGDAVIYALPAPIIPELTLLAAPRDPAGAKAELDEALKETPILGGAERRQTRIGDADATVVDLGRISLVYAVVGERLVVSTLPGAIRSVQEGGDKLVDDDRYRDALDAAGVEDGEAVVAYADLRQALKLAEGLSMLGGGTPSPSPDASKGLQALRSLVAATSGDGDEATFRLFVGVE